MPAPLSPMTPELRALIEKTHRAEAAKGNSTSKRRIAAILTERGQPVSDRIVYQVQKKMPDYNPKKSYKPPPPRRTPQSEISAKALKVALDNLKNRGFAVTGLSNKEIIKKSGELNRYESKKDLNIVRSRLATYRKNKSSPEKVRRANELLSRLNTDNSLATNQKFLQELEAVKSIGAKPKQENPVRKSQKRRLVIQRQTLPVDLTPARQVELAASGYDVSRGESKKNVNIKKLFPGVFEADHIRSLKEGGLNTPENIQILTKEQHNIKRGLENRGLMERAAGLFNFNPKVGPAAGLLAENIIPVQPDLLTQQSLLFFDPLLMKKRWDYD